MIYLVKFIYQWLLPPAGIFLILFGLNLYGWRHRQRGRVLFSVVLAVFYLLSIRVGADLLVKPLENWTAPPQQIDGDVLLMLGNGSVGGVPDLDGVGQPSGTMAKSMLTTIRLYQQTKLPILISGGTVYADTGTEADIASRQFQQMGVPEHDLYAENRSRNTVENARFAAGICRQQGWQHPILLVVAAQAPRTAMIFEREGLSCEIYPTHYRRTAEWHFNPIIDLIPDAGNLQDSAMALKEYLGIAAIQLGAQ